MAAPTEPGTFNPPPPRPSRWADWVVITAFVGLLVLPLVDNVLHIDRAPVTGENRLPTPAPQLPGWHWDAIRKFPAGFEAYYNDHYGYRKRLIRWYQRWKISLYRDRSVYRVTIGKDGWLFWAQQEMVENYLGLTPFTEDQLKAWQSLLEHRRDWLAKQGIQYVFVVPPDKHNVYPEELPDWLIKATPAHRVTKFDQFLAYMKAHSTVTIVDLRPTVIAAKKTLPTYLKNDTHWNLYGAFVACQQMVQLMSDRLPGGLPPLRLEDYTYTNCYSTWIGDVGQMISTRTPEKNYFEFTPKPGRPAPVIVDTTNIVVSWDWHKRCSICTNPAAPAHKLVMFNDSFGEGWKPFLGDDFQQIIYMYDNREFNKKVIAEYHPDIVVNEMLERFFDTLDPRTMSAKEEW